MAGGLKFLKSPLKLLRVVLRDFGGIVSALIRGDTGTAAIRTRHLFQAVHDDLIEVILVWQRILPFGSKPDRTIKRILIVKLDRIGDMVTTTPVFDTLRAAYPEARLDIIGHPLPLSLLEGDERIHDRIGYKSWMYHPVPIRPGGPRLWFLILKLFLRRYQLVVYLRGSIPFLCLALTSRFAAAKFEVGEPVITRYLRALEPFVDSAALTRQPRLFVSEEITRISRKLLETDFRQGPVVVIHATASSAAKMWPPERFADLADRLALQFDARIHFLGGPDDRAHLEGILKLADRSHRYHCSLSLPEVVGVIQEADLFIGNDSGLSHIAAAVGTRTVVLWGPVNLSMARPEAPPDRCVILYHELACRSRCPETHCVNPVAFECLLRTETGDVVQAAQQLMNGAGSQKRLPLTLNYETSSP